MGVLRFPHIFVWGSCFWFCVPSASASSASALSHLLRTVVCVQAWHLVTSLLLLRGRHGAYGTGLALVASLAAGGPALTQRGKKHLHRVVHATVRVLAALCFRTRLCCTSCFAACSCTKQSGILSPVTSLAGGAGCRRVVCLGPTLGS